MELNFLGQPYPEFGGVAADWLSNKLADPHLTNLYIASAWAKRSALARLQPSLTAFSARGGHSNIIVGIDEGGATRQGLELVTSVFMDAYVMFDARRRSSTFHPKIYLLTGKERASLLVGSNNLTFGGMFTNYEGAIICDLHFTRPDDLALIEQVQSWFESLLLDTNICKRLDLALIEQLVGAAQYRIADESRAWIRQEVEMGDGLIDKAVESEIFTTSSRLRTRSQLEKLPPSKVRKQVRQPRTFDTNYAGISGSESDTHRTKLQWMKSLTASDAQRRQTANTSETGNLRLTQAKQLIDHKTFFRDELFGDAAWSTQKTTKGQKETAIIDFSVIVEERDIGMCRMTLDHANYRIANQNNAPTWLHWDPKMLGILRNTDYKGAWVVIELAPDGTYHLTISREKPD